MPNLNFDVTANDEASAAFERLGAQIEKAVADLDEFGAKHVEATVEVNTAGVDEAKAKVDELAASSAEVHVGADTSELTSKLAEATVAADTLTRDPKQMKLDADTAVLEAKLGKARQLVEDLNTKRANPQIDVDIEQAQRRIMLIQGNLDYLAENAKGRSQVVIDVETAQANARLAEAKARLEELQRTRPRIDLDISSAEAKVAALEAQLAGLSAATDDAGNSADKTSSKFNLMATAIGAAFAPASAAVIALPGLLQLVVDPLGAIAVGLDGIEAAGAPLVGQFNQMQAVVGATFERGLKPAIADTAALMPTLTTGLAGTAGALTTVATQVGRVVASAPGLSALQTSFQNVNTIIAGMAPGIAGLVQNVLDLGALGTGSLGGLVNVVNGLSTQWHNLITSLSASGQAQAAVSALISVLGSVLALLPPLVSAGVQLMAVLGPPLAGAIQLLGGALNFLTGPLGAVTTTLIAGVAAYKLLGAGIDALTAKFGASAAASTTAAAATGAASTSSVAAAAAASAAATALGEEAVAAAAAATAAEANATALAADAAAAEATAVAFAAAAVSDGDLAVAAEAAAVATQAQAAAAGAAATAVEAQAVAARTAAVAGAANAEATAASGVAASGAAASTGGFAAAATRLGPALLAIGVGVIGGYTAIKTFTTSTNDVVSALGRGGQAADDFRAKAASQTQVSDANASALQKWGDSVDNWISSEVFGIATTDSVNKAQAEHRASLTGLQRAQEDATTAQGNLTQAVDKYGPKSQQAADAQRAYAAATLAVTKAQSDATVAATNIDASLQAAAAHFGDAAVAADGASQSTASYAAALASIANPMGSASDAVSGFGADTQSASDAALTLLSATDQMDQSIQKFADSTIKITPALVDATGAINTTTKAGQELAHGVQGFAKGFEDLRGATIASAKAAGDDLPTALVKGDVAMEGARQKLITLAMQHGATRQQAQGLVDTYLAFPPSVKTELSTDGAVKATAEALGLKDQITSLPDSKSVVVKSLTADARKQLEDLGLVVTTLPNGQIIITADGALADAEVSRVITAAASHEAVIPVGADTAGFNNALRDGVGAAQATVGVMKLDASPAPAGLKRDLWKQETNATVATAKMDADPKPAGLKRDQWKEETGRTTGTAIMDANPKPAGVKRDLWKQETNSTTGTAKLDADPARATQKRDLWKTDSDKTVATPTMDANTVPALHKRDLWKAETDRTMAIPTMDANTAPAGVKRDIWKQETNSTVVIPTMDADTRPAALKRDLWKQETNAAVGRPKMDLDDSPARSKALGTVQWMNSLRADMKLTVTTIYSGSSPAAVRMAGANGGMIRPMADGGIVGGADGMFGGLTPMPGGLGQVVPANTWRVIGDRMDVPESYIPQDGSPRSKDILDATATAMGFGLIPSTLMDQLRGVMGGPPGGGPLAQRIQTAIPMPRPAGSPGATVDMGGVVAQLQRVEGLLAAALRDPRVLNIVQNNPIAEKGSDSLARAARTVSTLGAVQFGGRR